MKVQDKDEERRFSDEYVTRTGGYHTYGEDLMQLFDSLGISSQPRDSLILDAGCGTGKCTTAMAKMGFKVVGVDISEKAIEFAKQTEENDKLDIDYSVQDLESLPFEDNKFDIVFCGGVLHHFPNLIKAEEELFRVLKPKGIFCAYETNKSNPVTFVLFTLADLARRILPIAYVKREFSINERALSIKELEGSLKSTGFSQLKFDSINIRNKSKDDTQALQRTIRNTLNFLCENLCPPLSRGRHLVISCVKEANE